jgi:hypothetical protein
MVEEQAKFLLTICDFIQKATKAGYQLTAGEFLRTPSEAMRNAQNGSGIKNSLHLLKLAADLNVFYQGKYLNGEDAWTIPHLSNLGHLWESLDPLCAWGGRFTRKDYNHYSFSHNGVK